MTSHTHDVAGLITAINRQVVPAITVSHASKFNESPLANSILNVLVNKRTSPVPKSPSPSSA